MWIVFYLLLWLLIFILCLCMIYFAKLFSARMLPTYCLLELLLFIPLFASSFGHAEWCERLHQPQWRGGEQSWAGESPWSPFSFFDFNFISYRFALKRSHFLSLISIFSLLFALKIPPQFFSVSIWFNFKRPLFFFTSGYFDFASINHSTYSASCFETTYK